MKVINASRHVKMTKSKRHARRVVGIYLIKLIKKRNQEGAECLEDSNLDQLKKKFLICVFPNAKEEQVINALNSIKTVPNLEAMIQKTFVSRHA